MVVVVAKSDSNNPDHKRCSNCQLRKLNSQKFENSKLPITFDSEVFLLLPVKKKENDSFISTKIQPTSICSWKIPIMHPPWVTPAKEFNRDIVILFKNYNNCIESISPGIKSQIRWIYSMNSLSKASERTEASKSQMCWIHSNKSLLSKASERPAVCGWHNNKTQEPATSLPPTSRPQQPQIKRPLWFYFLVNWGW